MLPAKTMVSYARSPTSSGAPSRLPKISRSAAKPGSSDSTVIVSAPVPPWIVSDFSGVSMSMLLVVVAEPAS